MANAIYYSFCFRFLSGSTISPLKNGFQFSPTDIDDCVNHTCSNGGSCVDGVNNYSCKCKPGFTGDRCQTGLFFSFYNQAIYLLLPVSSVYFLSLFLSLNVFQIKAKSVDLVLKSRFGLQAL